MTNDKYSFDLSVTLNQHCFSLRYIVAARRHTLVSLVVFTFAA